MTSSTAPTTEALTEIGRFLAILHERGGTFEVRAPKAIERKGGTFRTTWSGYYADADAAAEAVSKFEDRSSAPGVYVTLNPVDPDLIARGPARFGAHETTSDLNILRRRWLLIDLDPVRPAGLSATDDELTTARLRGEEVRADLARRGWPDPVVLDSGNGTHLLYRIDLPTDDGGLVKRVLETLAEAHDDDRVKVDRSVHNPARITKIGGTWTRKGEHFLGSDQAAARPHRRATITEEPAEIGVVPREMLEALAPPTPPPPAQPVTTTPRRGGGRFAEFDSTPEGVRGYLEQHGVRVRKTIDRGDETVLVLEACPIAPTCTATGDSDIGVLVNRAGRVAYCNQHNRGQGLAWIDVRDALEPGYREHVAQAQQRHTSPLRPTASLEARPTTPIDTTPPQSFAARLPEILVGLQRTHGRKRLGLALTTLSTIDKRLSGIRGFMLLAGEPGAGKTSLAQQVGLEVLESEENEDVATIIVSAEMDQETLDHRLLSQVSRVPYTNLRRGSAAPEGNWCLNGMRPEDRWADLARQPHADALDALMLSGDHREALSNARQEIARYGDRLFTLDLTTTPDLRFTDLDEMIRETKKASGCSRALIVIDSLQAVAGRVRPGLGRDWSNDVERDNVVIAELLALHKRHGDPLLLTAEQNKQGMGQADLTSTRGTARAAYSPDTVAFLVREDHDDDTEPPAQVPVDLVVKKARDGGTRGTVTLEFHHHETRFEEVERSSLAKQAKAAAKQNKDRGGGR